MKATRLISILAGLIEQLGNQEIIFADNSVPTEIHVRCVEKELKYIIK